MHRKIVVSAIVIALVICGSIAPAFADVAGVMEENRVENYRKIEFYLYDYNEGGMPPFTQRIITINKYLGAIVLTIYDGNIKVENHLIDQTKIPDGIATIFYRIYGWTDSPYTRISDDPEENISQRKNSITDTNRRSKAGYLTFANNNLNGTSEIITAYYNEKLGNFKYENKDIELYFKNNIADGPTKSIFDKEFFEEGNYTNGFLDGKSIRRDAYGRIVAEGTYKKGVFNGILTSYNNNGRITAESYFKNGKLNGEQKEYSYKTVYSYTGSSEELVKQTTTPYLDDEINGDKIERFYEAGTLEPKSTLITTYKLGHLISDTIYGGPDNKILQKTTYDMDGEPIFIHKYGEKGKEIEIIDIRKIKKAEKAKSEEIRYKLSSINMFFNYNDIVALLGKPSNSPIYLPNGENAIEVHGSGIATWHYKGHTIDVYFQDRLTQMILLDKIPYRSFF